MELQKQIEELIAQDADDFEVSKAIKGAYKLYLASLEESFRQTYGKKFLVKHTKAIDGFLKVIYKYIIRKYFGDYSPMHNALPITLLALGSYGREQLCIYSDIDLMLVYKEIPGYNTKAIMESLLSMAWDSGLKLGHRVHEVSDLLEASRSEHTIKTAMIESRFICGSKFVWIETQNQLTLIRKENQKAFIETKLQEYHDRHKRYPIEMRANIKAGAGGMRDLNTVYWIGSILHHARRVRDMVPQHIGEKEYAKMMKSMEFIFRLRAALHLVAKKKQDILILELIPDVAKLLNLTQRKVAEKTYQALVEIETLADIFIWRLCHEILDDTHLPRTVIHDDLYIYHDRLYADTTKKGADFLEAFQTVLRENKKIKNYDITFLIYLRASTFSARNAHLHHQLSLAFFYHDNSYWFLIALYRSKLLSRFFHPLAKVKFLPQFDGYHRYPVDLHSMHCMRALQNITDSNVKKIYNTLNDDEKAILRLSTFLHDCGKGRRKDHSELGANIVKHYASTIGFDAKMAHYASILVRYHTLMSNIAAREDIYNEKVIYAFIAKIKHPIILKMLYVLTFADVESVSEGCYSSFNANLLKELYLHALEAFSHDAMITEAGKRAKKEQQLLKYKPFLTRKRSTQKRMLSIQSNLLFFKYTPREITTLATWIELKKAPYEYKITHNHSLCIEILTSKELNVGYLLGKLSNLDIATMDIFAVGQKTKYFKIGFLENIQDDAIHFVEEIVENAFDMKKKTALPSLTITKKEIDIYCEHSTSYARMKVNCRDQKGLIANIIGIFDDMGIDIASAKIQTIKNRARNLFLIEKNGKFCDSQDIIIKKLTQQG